MRCCCFRNCLAKGFGLIRSCSAPNLWCQVKPKLVLSKGKPFVIPWLYVRKEAGWHTRMGTIMWDRCYWEPNTDCTQFLGHAGVQEKLHPSLSRSALGELPACFHSERIQRGCTQGFCCEKLQNPPFLWRHFPKETVQTTQWSSSTLNQLGKAKTKIKKWHYSVTFTAILSNFLSY